MSKKVETILKERGKWGMRLGLMRIEKLLEELGNPQDDLKIVHVAGSNGKGSTVKILETIAVESGLKVGSFTSPALENDRERIKINGKMIDEKTIEKLFSQVEEAAKIIKEKTGESATGFELETAIAFLYFKEENVDLALIEVGLGGRLDATNVIKNPLVDVITHISLEHTDYLGDTLEKIATEKGGIIKDNSHLVVAPQEVESRKALEKIAEKHTLKSVEFLTSNRVTVLENSLGGQKLLIDNKEFFLNLLGSFQRSNLLTALEVVKALRKEGFKIEDDNIKKALKKVSFPGRFERVFKSPDIIIDGAHNIDGIGELTVNLENYYRDQKEIFIFGVLEEKDTEGIVEHLIPRAEKIYLVEPDSPLALENSKLKELIKKRARTLPVVTLKSPEELASIIDFENKDSHYVVTGSLYLISKVRPILTELIKQE